ncbi:ABC transporter permease [Phreatobacter stygius]|uniref:ABC transporter permease n=2 Tax=Phreatobacter stygius TaxID=1940610 RepID=A0A4D7BMY3_9HYPH|nr:ABC transporter permease [Phreatobacter stygius]
MGEPSIAASAATVSNLATSEGSIVLTSLSADDRRRAFRDITSGIRQWRIWWLLGTGDIRSRYARSRLGQLWITVSMAIFVIAIGLVYSMLFNQPIQQFLPYIAANMVVWALIAGIIGESGTIFTQSESFLRQEPLPRTVFVMRILVRNTMSFAHNIILVPICFLAMGHWPSWTWLLVPLGLGLILIAGFFTALLLGLLCTRFRDLPQIIQSIIQIAFLITPVMWPAESLRGKAAWVVNYNPFAAFLHIVAEPLRGIVPSAWTYSLAVAAILLLAAASLPLFTRFRARIVYWL